jgi:hypothetical protein
MSNQGVTKVCAHTTPDNCTPSRSSSEMERSFLHDSEMQDRADRSATSRQKSQAMMTTTTRYPDQRQPDASGNQNIVRINKNVTISSRTKYDLDELSLIRMLVSIQQKLKDKREK